MHSQKVLETCDRLGLSPDELYDDATASEKLVCSKHSVGILWRTGRLRYENPNMQIRFRGAHIAERYIKRYGLASDS